MNQKALKTLEYTKIIAQLESHAASPLGKALCRDLVPSSDLEEVRTWQAQTTDAADRVRLKGTVSFSGLRDIGSSLKRLEIGSALSISELLSISSVLTVAARAKSLRPSGRPGKHLYTTFSRSAATETDSSRGICA